MKLLSCFVLFFSLEMYHAKQIPTLQDTTRIPRTEIPLMAKYLTVPLQYDGSTFSGNISIGARNRNPKPFNVQFDTGSMNLWVYSRFYQPHRINSRRHNQYISADQQRRTEGSFCPEKSSIRYLKGCVQGLLASDKVEIKGFGGWKTFTEVTKATQDQENQVYDGVLGLQYNPQGLYDHIVLKLCDKDYLKFSFNLPSFGSRNEAQLTFCLENKRVHPMMNYVDEKVKGKWKIQIESSFVYSNMRSNKRITLATIDTGSNVIVGPRTDINNFYTSIKNIIFGVKPYKINCNYIQYLPTLNFGVGNKYYTLTGRDYVWTIDKRNNICQLAIYDGPQQFDEWVLGEPFLRKVYVEFDMVNGQIGFAQK